MQAAQLAETQELLKLLRHSLEQPDRRTVEIRIDTIHVDQADLKELVFRLDKLDIEELSGALNLGNNFGTKVWHPSHDNKQKTGQNHVPPLSVKQASSEPDLTATKPFEQEDSKWVRTGKGYSVRIGD